VLLVSAFVVILDETIMGVAQPELMIDLDITAGRPTGIAPGRVRGHLPAGSSRTRARRHAGGPGTWVPGPPAHPLYGM